jgi:hypothetical protein
LATCGLCKFVITSLVLVLNTGIVLLFCLQLLNLFLCTVLMHDDDILYVTRPVTSVNIVCKQHAYVLNRDSLFVNARTITMIMTLYVIV